MFSLKHVIFCVFITDILLRLAYAGYALVTYESNEIIVVEVVATKLKLYKVQVKVVFLFIWLPVTITLLILASNWKLYGYRLWR